MSDFDKEFGEENPLDKVDANSETDSDFSEDSSKIERDITESSENEEDIDIDEIDVSKSVLEDTPLDEDIDIDTLDLTKTPLSENQRDQEFEDTESDEFEEREEEFQVGGDKSDIWGSQQELEYLLDKYLEAEQGGLSAEEISETMKEAEHTYKELQDQM